MNPQFFWIGVFVGQVIRQHADTIRSAWSWLAWPSRLYGQIDSLPTATPEDRP